MGMTNVFKAFILAAAMMAGTCFSAFAATPQTVEDARKVILEADDFTNTDHGICFISEGELGASDELDGIIGKYFRGCDALTELRQAVINASVDSPVSTTYRHYITDSMLQDLVGHQTALDTWSSKTAKETVPDGMTKYDASRTAYLYITANYPYDYAAAADYRTSAPAQSGYYALVNGKGICASQSRLFRCLTEAIPFNPDSGLVDWQCDTPQYLSVINISGHGHQFAAIDFGGDAGVRYYECTAERAILDESAAERTYRFSGVGDPTYDWEY